MMNKLHKVLSILKEWKNIRVLLTFLHDSYLKEEGWFKSNELHAPVSIEKLPIPWISYPCLDFISERIVKDFIVFEYGSGGSSLWWSKRVTSIVSCEHDPIWYEKLFSSGIPENMQLIYEPLSENGPYAQKIKQIQLAFDIIVIDGRDRVNCMKHSADCAKESAVIIVDNSDRQAYQEGFEYLNQKGYKRIDFWGMSALLTRKTCTSVFYKQNNALNI